MEKTALVGKKPPHWAPKGNPAASRIYKKHPWLGRKKSPEKKF